MPEKLLRLFGLEGLAEGIDAEVIDVTREFFSTIHQEGSAGLCGTFQLT